MKTIKIVTFSDLIPQVWRRIWWWFAVRRDPQTGKLYYVREGRRVYVNHRRDWPYWRDSLWTYENVIFKPYRPKAGDTVVDIGAGYGEESVFLGPDVRYIGVEIQPSTYECLANTARGFPQMKAVPFAIADGPVYITTSRYNESASQVVDGYIETPHLTWNDFLSRYGVESVDLLKINIEGGELAFLQHADLSRVKRIVVCCHDFRANRGDSESFRTYDRVRPLLESRGLKMQRISENGPDWSQWWFYVDCQSP